MSQVNSKLSTQLIISGKSLSGLTKEEKTKFILSRMHALQEYNASRMQPAPLQPPPMQTVSLQDVSMDPGMDPDQMQYAQMQAGQMQTAQMQTAQMPSAQMQAVQIPYAHPQQAAQLVGVTSDHSSQASTTANALSESSEGQASQPGPQTGSLIPPSPSPGQPIDTVALRQDVKRELDLGWRFDTRAWSKRPDPLLNYLYGFTREQYMFIKHRKLLNTNPFDIQWEIDRREESDRLNALRPWYRNEGTDDSDLVPLSGAALFKALDAFYDGMENVNLLDVKTSDPINGDDCTAAGVASNPSGTEGKNTLNSFVDEANSSGLSSKFSIKAGPGECFIDSGICLDEGIELSLWKPARSSYRCDEESGTASFPDDEDELISDDNTPYDLEGFTSDRYHDAACDLQLGPWQTSMGELTKQYLLNMSDYPPDQAYPSAGMDSAASPMGLNKSAPYEAPEAPKAPSVDVAISMTSLIGSPTEAKQPTYPLNSASSENSLPLSSLPLSPDPPTSRASPLWEKRLINAGLAPHIGRHYRLRSKLKPGDARFALLEQLGEMGPKPDVSSGRLSDKAFLTSYKTQNTAQKRHSNDEDADSDDTLKAQDADTSRSSHKPLKKKSKKVGELKAGSA